MAGINENGKSSVSPMNQQKKPLLKDINHFLTCILCDGYFFNATTIVECAHTYCRACIVKFLKTKKYCPTCDAQGHRTKSNPSLRYDSIIQKLVYKTVPGLYQDELSRRNSQLKESQNSDEDVANGDDRLDEDYYFSPDEPISISLEYIDNKIDGHRNNVIKSSGNIDDATKDQMKHKRYLQCPAKLTIRHIYKFIKLKYNLQRNQEVEVLYDKTKLPGSFSLMDVAYTFSWNRDTPMRLCYEILESITIKVPQTVTDKMSNKSVPVKNNFVTNSSSPNNIGNDVQSTNEVHFEETSKTENLTTKVNLKRKLDVAEITSNTKESTSEDLKDVVSKDEPSKEGVELPGQGLLVKVPRISNSTFKDIMDFKKDGQHEDKPKPTATVSPCTENGLKLPLKPTMCSDDFTDEYMKYEQDIEEVEDDDDDDEDDDRLRISHLSEEDTQDDKIEETSDQNMVTETSDVETTSTTKEDPKEQKMLNGDVSKKSTKYKRKSKKSKHSHHHKHRHHERKSKGTPQATILHSPDTDIMKLKLKLNNVKPDTKYHKQKRKRKKSSECYFSSSFSSSSSASSVNGMSPDAHSTSRADEDSLHSHTSELSAESMDTLSSKDETSTKAASPAAEPTEKYQSPASKEKLLQMRAFRPRNIAVVKPEENHQLEKHVDKPSKNDNNNNDSTTIVENKEKPKTTSAAPVVLRPPSSITVSKITAAEKQKMEQEKLLMMNGNNDDKPSLEIMLVNGPPSSAKSTKSFVTPAISSTSDTTTKPKTPPRPTRPPPAAIPIVQYQKMKSNEQSPPNIPKSLTITPQIQRSKSANDSLKKAKDVLSIRGEGVKRSVSVSLSGNPSFHNDFNGALDLSSGIKSVKYSDTINVPHTLLNKKICMNGIRPMQNGVRPMPNSISSYSPVRSLSALADVHPSFHKHPSSPNRLAISSSPKHKMFISSPQTSPKLIPSRSNNTTKLNKTNVPNLNEIKIGPVSSSTEIPSAPKPGPNQTVRQIPNPSIMLQRHQATVNNIAATALTDYVPIKLPHPNSIMGHRITSNACSFSSLKKTSDKCPPAIPLKGYYDISSVMATK